MLYYAHAFAFRPLSGLGYGEIQQGAAGGIKVFGEPLGMLFIYGAGGAGAFRLHPQTEFHALFTAVVPKLAYAAGVAVFIRDPTAVKLVPAGHLLSGGAEPAGVHYERLAADIGHLVDKAFACFKGHIVLGSHAGAHKAALSVP